MIREVIYIPYEKQDEYREAGWRIKPLTHSYQKEYGLMAVREVEDEGRRRMSPITIIIPGKPVPYARTGGGKSAVRFTPKKQRNEMAFVRALAAQEMAGRPPIAEPVKLVMRSVMPIPQSWPKKKQAAALAGEVLPTGRPDLSNLTKLIEDSLNGVVFVDDSQIVRLEAEKVYGPQAMTVVKVTAV